MIFIYNKEGREKEVVSYLLARITSKLTCSHLVHSPFLLQAVPKLSLHLPPVGVHRMNPHLYKVISKRFVLPLAWDSALSVGEQSIDCVALRALNVHEVGVGRLNESLQLVESFFSNWVYV